jgi:hypothetical protein
MQQGGDRDEVWINVTTGGHQKTSRFGGDAADPARMGDDAIRKVEGGKQQLGLGGSRYGHAPIVRADRPTGLGAAATERHGSAASLLPAR